ncbi:hypothetical protein [Ruegeria marina]|nr:hypothetical protein [Ruegeria marina]
MVLTDHGGLNRSEWRTDWLRPEPALNEVLIRVGACGLNTTDVNTRTGWYAKAVSEAVTGHAPAELRGCRGMVNGWLRDRDDPDNKNGTGYSGSERDRGFAEYCVADTCGVEPVESPLGDAETATVACSRSAAEGMLAHAEVGPGDTVLAPDDLRAAQQVYIEKTHASNILVIQ